MSDSDQQLLFAFYGDDFTGSTDALESLVLGGIPAMLFLRPPSREELKSRYPWLRAVGIAGDARSKSPAQMRASLPPIFQGLAQLQPRAFHYKVCSTFDSSPTVGNLAVAAELAAAAFGQDTVYALGGAPRLGRYLAFGHLFARYGADGIVYRIDRHPVMSRHPTTPMTESDLRLHISAQSEDIEVVGVGTEQVGSRTDLPGPARDDESAKLRLILFDAVSERDVTRFGEAAAKAASGTGAAVLLGPSSVGAAVAERWGENQQLEVEQSVVPTEIDGVESLLVLSGSCSPMTAAQVEHAVENGFARIDIEPAELGAGTFDSTELIRKIVGHLSSGRSVVVTTCHDGARHEQGELAPELVGAAFGAVVTGVLSETSLSRLVLAGGDSSSQTLQSLGIDALEMVAAVSPGVPLCSIHASGQRLDGVEIALKGGQLGGIDYLVRLRDGDES